MLYYIAKEGESMKTRRIILSALFAALICVATLVIRIPLPVIGYINMGDCFVLLAGIFFGPLYGGIASGIGSAFADLISGYPIYLPFTFVIKFLMAVVISVLYKKYHNKIGYLTGALLAEITMIVGYFLTETLFFSSFLVAATGVVGNCIQGLGGIIISILLFPVIKRSLKRM